MFLAEGQEYSLTALVVSPIATLNDTGWESRGPGTKRILISSARDKLSSNDNHQNGGSIADVNVSGPERAALLRPDHEHCD